MWCDDNLVAINTRDYGFCKVVEISAVTKRQKDTIKLPGYLLCKGE